MCIACYTVVLNTSAYTSLALPLTHTCTHGMYTWGASKWIVPKPAPPNDITIADLRCGCRPGCFHSILPEWCCRVPWWRCLTTRVVDVCCQCCQCTLVAAEGTFRCQGCCAHACTRVWHKIWPRPAAQVVCARGLVSRNFSRHVDTRCAVRSVLVLVPVLPRAGQGCGRRNVTPGCSADEPAHGRL